MVLNSSSGGVVQDNYLYSSYTYIIQSNLSVDIWRNKIKETLKRHWWSIKKPKKWLKN